MRRFPLLSALAFLLLAAAFLPAFWVRIIDADLFLHLKTGELIWQMRSVPQADPFSATVRGSEWIAHEWLWELAAYTIQRWTGWVGLSVVRMMTFAAALLLPVLAARQRKASWFAGATAATVMICSLMAFPEIRPQTVTFAFFGLCLLLFERARTRPWLLLALPPLVLLWANLHGAFLVVFLLAAATGAGWLTECGLAARRQRGQAGQPDGILRAVTRQHLFRPFLMLAGASLASLAASLVNPNGTELLTYPLKVIGDSTLRQSIAEWRAPELTRPFLPFYLTTALAGAVLLLGRKGTRPDDWFLFALFTASALTARRQIPLFALAVLPALSVALTHLLRDENSPAHHRPRAASRVVALGAAAALFVGSLVCYQGTRGSFGAGIQPGRFPERAATVLATTGGGGSLLNDYNDGGYLIWRLWPRWNVIIDGRVDIYGRKVTDLYTRAWLGRPEECGTLLQRLGIHAIVGRYDVARISPGQNLYRYLAQSSDWSLVHWDDTAMLYLPASSGGTPDHKPYRRVHPALPLQELLGRQKTPEELAALSADLRRAEVEEPESVRVRRLKRMVEQYEAEKNRPGSAPAAEQNP